jgi:hypothetical protein
VVFKEQFLTTSESMLHIENKSWNRIVKCSSELLLCLRNIKTLSCPRATSRAMYKTGLPPSVCSLSEHIFADDRSVIICGKKFWCVFGERKTYFSLKWVNC